MFLMNLMSTVNTFTLSFYSDEAVAAVGSAGQFMGMILNFYSVISTGASIVISQNLGAKRKKCIRCCFLCAVCRCRVKRSPWCYTFVLFHAPDAADEFIRPGINICLFLPENLHSCFLFAAFVSICSAIFKSYGKPKISVFVTLGMNALNALLNYLIVFQPVELPLHGVEGIACAYAFSEGCAAFTMLLLLLVLPLGLDFRHKSIRSSFRILPKVLQIGIPGGISTLSYSVSQVVTTSIIALVGVQAVSAKIYVSTLVFYVYVLGLSLGLSTSLLISWLTGAGKYEQAYQLNLQNLKSQFC